MTEQAPLTPDRGYTEAEGYAASLRQQAKWVQECHGTVDADELDDAADFIDRLSAELEKAMSWKLECEALEKDVERLSAATERAEGLVDLLEANARTQAKLLADTGRAKEAAEAKVAELSATMATPDRIEALAKDYAERWDGLKWDDDELSESDITEYRIEAQHWLKCWQAVCVGNSLARATSDEK